MILIDFQIYVIVTDWFDLDSFLHTQHYEFDKFSNLRDRHRLVDCYIKKLNRENWLIFD